MSIEDVIEILEMGIEGGMEHFQDELAKINTGRASTSAFEKVRVEIPSWEGTFLLREVGTLSLQNPLTVGVVLFDAKTGPEVERALLKANLGVSIGLKEGRLFLTVPPLSGERREELARRARDLAEETRVRIRRERREARTALSDLESEIGEDAVRRGEGLVEERVVEGLAEVDRRLALKSSAILDH